ncbi:GNAT family N-acetyltransferase [Paracraurococcus lichenis]|uniref:GNAT family N-acetyltransferase n=1 Tax=Paracraurococcus lichenis TaxID=3064888 RepID=A0ABT9EA93_9PROT|nr:GNAT family N-acetyltransferase [Paracraurococcus sp. LOR1-02]MDO9713089.1 GNAT family N-acetyltransferase [Paracraurococcus sp. LOR1-02]
MPVDIEMEQVHCFDRLSETWRALEVDTEASFFQSWTWVGCLATERYPDPILLRARRGGRLVGLALFNRRRGRLHLAESGDPERDRPFTEHNGPLATDPEAAAALLRAAWRPDGARRLVLGGVPPDLPALAGGIALRQQVREAPFLDLEALRVAGGDYLARLSANTRYQIRRSNRLYAAGGALALAAAEDAATLEAWFGELTALHEASWARRGQPGAFATPWLRRFHRSLMARALAEGVLDLLRITGGAGTVGILYNFRHRGRVLAYQSGLADPAGEAHARPGLTCHALAIDHALARGDRVYDFLAGGQRYKRSLADRQVSLVWAELARAGSAAGLLGRLHGLWRRRRRDLARTA